MSESKKIDEGGFAFPTSQISAPDGRVLSVGQDGMSMRDWLAGLALNGMLSAAPFRNDVTYSQVATAAYEWADAMIAARKAGAA